MKKIVFVVLVGLGIWFISNQEGFVKDKCSKEYILSKVEKIYQNSKGTPEGQSFDAKSDELIRKGSLKESRRDDFLRANLELIVMTEYGCEIPAELNDRVTVGYGGNPDGKSCASDAYTREAEEQYNQFLKDEAAFKIIESQAFSQIIQEIGSEAGKQKFSEKWKDPDFKELLLIAVFDIGLREENDCSNVALPMVPLLQQMY